MPTGWPIVDLGSTGGYTGVSVPTEIYGLCLRYAAKLNQSAEAE